MGINLFFTGHAMRTSGVLLVCMGTVAFNDAFFLPGRPVLNAILGRPKPAIQPKPLPQIQPRPLPQVQPRPMIQPRPMPIIAVDPVPETIEADEDPCPPRCTCEFSNGAISSMQCVGEGQFIPAPPCKVKNCGRCLEDNPKKCSNCLPGFKSKKGGKKCKGAKKNKKNKNKKGK